MTNDLKPGDLTKIDIAIATAGRREVLSETIDFLGNQTRLADALLICPAKSADVDGDVLSAFPGPSRIVSGPVGLPAQRNAIMAASSADILVFLDDDFLPAPDFLMEVERLFQSDPSIVVATGEVLADGILGPGLSFDEGQAVLAKAGDNRGAGPRETNNGYGCNMIVRMSAVRALNVRFDEALPLYAWLEDLDFSRQLAPAGRIVKAPRLRGVHLGTKRSGRSPGKRLGYSQVANPIYLARKGTMPWRAALRQIFRNIVANVVYSFKPEPWVDRKGRIAGNVLALTECAMGRMTPSRILDFQ